MVAQRQAVTSIQPIESNVQWMSPPPLWPSGSARQPFIARFETDRFMDEFAALFDDKNRGTMLQARRAQARSYRRLFPGETTAPALQKLKLYQPVHGHFYLITATLVCQQLGLPDRVINAGAQERAVFVLRRMVMLNGVEYEQSWTDTNGVKGWVNRPTDACRKLALGEVTYPLFPTTYHESDGRMRRVLAGLIPTSSRETATAVALDQADPLFADAETVAGTPIDPRMTEFETRLNLSLKALLLAAAAPGGTSALERQREASFFWLLDLGELLSLHHPTVWTAVNGGALPTGNALLLYNWLNETVVDGTKVLNLLKDTWDNQRTKLYSDPPETIVSTVNFAGLSATHKLSTLEPTWKDALPTLPPTAPPTSPAALSLELQVTRAAPKIDAFSTYVIRCVYQRPLCGCLQPDTASEASDRFTIAPYFDPDAPARPIRITMPADTSIAGLRKYTRSVGIEMSKELRRQISRVSDAKKALNGELGGELSLDLGVICSFSIPVITIVALLLLMIFVVLLNIIFWWLPFVRICFPIKPR